jgi:hypothetical protein
VLPGLPGIGATEKQKGAYIKDNKAFWQQLNNFS